MGRKGLVLGLSISGKGAFLFLKSLGFEVLGVDKVRPQWIDDKEFALDDQNLDISLFDLIVLSPGIAQTHPLICQAKEKNIEVIGEVELGCRYLKNRCLGITGTNGKSTTCSLISWILNQNQIKARAVGNIGVSLCETLLTVEKDEVLVLELSSYQLETMKTKILEKGAILNITPDHLNRYGSLDEYARAKAKILDCLLPNGKVYLPQDVKEKFPYFEKGIGFTKEQMLATLKPLGYIDNRPPFFENIYIAYLLLEGFSIKVENFVKATTSFQPLEHRIELVANVNGVFVYNDSKATNPEAALFALEKFSSQVVLLLGGEDKNLSFSVLKDIDNIKSIVAYGRAKEKIKKELGMAFTIQIKETLKEALVEAFSSVEKGDTILFSPGCSSFDQFENYQQRGSIFKNLVLAYQNGELVR